MALLDALLQNCIFYISLLRACSVALDHHAYGGGALRSSCANRTWR